MSSDAFRIFLHEFGIDVSRGEANQMLRCLAVHLRMRFSYQSVYERLEGMSPTQMEYLFERSLEYKHAKRDGGESKTCASAHEQLEQFSERFAQNRRRFDVREALSGQPVRDARNALERAQAALDAAQAQKNEVEALLDAARRRKHEVEAAMDDLDRGEGNYGKMDKLREEIRNLEGYLRNLRGDF